MKSTRIVIFAKAPLPGLAKTRLIPVLGEVGAGTLAAGMLARTVAAAIDADLAQPELCATPHPDSPEWPPFLPAGVRATDQGSGDLGERLARAASRVIAGGEGVLLIGADCPALDASRLREAASQLRTHDAVIHPARDGGYALLGLTRFDPSLFTGIAWSTDTVAHATQTRIEALGWSLWVGDTLRDIDEPADLDVAGAVP